MKLLARFAPLLALLAVSAVTWVTLRATNAANPWQPLFGGGEVRVLAVTCGSEHTVDLGGVSWKDRCRAAWQQRSLRPLTAAGANRTTSSSGGRSLALWLEGRNLSAGFTCAAAELVLPDGQLFRSGGGSGGNPGGRSYSTVFFPIIPARAKSLRFRAQLHGERHEFHVPNPACRTDLPVWKAEPLPQTRVQEDIALTLHALQIQRNSDPSGPTNWRASPTWRVAGAAAPAPDAYRLDVAFEDPSGNLSRGVGLCSEPVWKVRAKMVRNDRSAFLNEELRLPGVKSTPLVFEFLVAVPAPPGNEKAGTRR